LSKYTLEVSGIQKHFGHRSVLSDIYMKCETGEIVGLFGRNGSGKSTLLKIIAGIISVPDACIRINSDSKNTTKTLLREINYLSQDSFIPKHLSVQKAIQLSVDKQNETFLGNDSFLQSILDKKIKHLSGGELRYLEVKLLLSNPSKFVLLDEPFSKLSPLMCDLVIDLIKENSVRKGIIITDHNHENVIRVCSRFVLLENGKLQNIKEKGALLY